MLGAFVSIFLIIQQHISLKYFSYNTGNEALVVLVGVYARKSLPEIYFLVLSTPPGFLRSAPFLCMHAVDLYMFCKLTCYSNPYR